jgi:hypothetical protein
MRNNSTSTSSLYFTRILILAGAFLLMFQRTSVAEHMHSGISFQVFYDELTPYGDWISHPVHGYVWVPYAEPGFQPYATNGYWVMSNYGNTWVSNYDWGWAPFHYGRWYFDDYVGWAWVPGYEWGPAWVNWRTGGNYYGWAPLMPGVNIHVSVNIPTNYWVFVPKKRLISRNIYNYYVPRRNVVNIYNQTTVINNTYVYNNQTYVSGPARRDVERVTRRSVPVYQVNNSDRPGRTSMSRNNLKVYQPAVRRTAENSETSARPSRVLSANEHKANLVSRSSNGSVTRTAPTNSRTTTNSRAPEVNRSDEGTTRRVETRSAAHQRATENSDRTRTSPSQRASIPSGDQKEAYQPKQPARATPSTPRQQSSPTPRTQAPQQQTRGQVAPRQQNIQQRATANTRQEVGRSTSAPRVSSGTSSDRSSGSASRGSSQSRGSRGNN